MAKVTVSGRQFTKCGAFWEAEEGESLTGVLVDMNEKFPNKIQGEDAVKPLYILRSIGDTKEKPSLNLDEKPVKNVKGLNVGVFDSADLHDKIFDHYDELLGKEITITFTKKDAFKKNGVTRSIKRFDVLAETEKHAEFAQYVVKRAPAAAPAPAATGAPAGDAGPYAV